MPQGHFARQCGVLFFANFEIDECDGKCYLFFDETGTTMEHYDLNPDSGPREVLRHWSEVTGENHGDISGNWDVRKVVTRRGSWIYPWGGYMPPSRHRFIHVDMPSAAFNQNWTHAGQDNEVDYQRDNHTVMKWEVRDRFGSVEGSLQQKLKISSCWIGEL